MARISAWVIFVTLLTCPTQAAGPLAFLAKDIATGIVRNFVGNQLSDMLTKMGPCGMPIGPTGGLATLARMLGSGQSLSDLGSLAGVGALSGVTGVGGLTALPNMAAVMGGLPPGMEKQMREQMAQMQDSAKETASAADGEAAPGEAADTSEPDVAQLMETMQDAQPLTSAEIDELGALMERLAGAVPSTANPCKPGELKVVLRSTADMPMGGGMLRMMLEPMRDMERNLAEARDSFAQMSASERNEYVALMTNEYKDWDKAHQQAFRGMTETNFLGMPDPIRKQLLARLK